jgi:hypothetical protein
MFSSRQKKILIVIIISLLLISSSLTIFFILRPNNSEKSYEPIDVALPSNSTGSPSGTIKLILYLPEEGKTRYPEGAPVLIWGYGGGTAGGLDNPLSPANDSIIINFLYPGGEDNRFDKKSDGVYDYRGENSILALRDVILFAAGELTDENGKTIDEIVPVSVIHNNIGLLGASFGGNIVVAVTALYGAELTDYLKYIIQWETPVSSQITNLDLGRVLPAPGEAGTQLDLYNPRLLSYGKQVLQVNYSDLAYNSSNEYYPVFHDGNGDGKYTTATHGNTSMPTPDLNNDGILSNNEDFPINYFLFQEINSKRYYSRSITQALKDYTIIPDPWPEEIATLAEANAFWDIREAVKLYEEAVNQMPNIKAMVLANEEDHVQSHPEKPHIHQAFDGWNDQGIWVKINPSPNYIRDVNPDLYFPQLPNNLPNTSPIDWKNHSNYCMPEFMVNTIYQTAAFYEMTDKTQQHLESLHYNENQFLAIVKISYKIFLINVKRNIKINEKFCFDLSYYLDNLS